jgi:uncharacterized protein YjbI with pentapeptide repeats
MDRDEALRLLRGGREGVREWNRRREEGKAIPDLSKANLRGADLRRANLRKADLRGAILSKANLSRADLSGVNLSGAHLSESHLSGANFCASDLREANFFAADLREANLSGADLSGADLSGAYCALTIFADVDLSEVGGFDTVRYAGPSEISISTLIRSRGQIPESFLRGCGLPEAWIEHIPSLIGMMQPIQFYSCFTMPTSRPRTCGAGLPPKT